MNAWTAAVESAATPSLLIAPTWALDRWGTILLPMPATPAALSAATCTGVIAVQPTSEIAATCWLVSWAIWSPLTPSQSAVPSAAMAAVDHWLTGVVNSDEAAGVGKPGLDSWQELPTNLRAWVRIKWAEKTRHFRYLSLL